MMLFLFFFKEKVIMRKQRNASKLQENLLVAFVCEQRSFEQISAVAFICGLWLSQILNLCAGKLLDKCETHAQSKLWTQGLMDNPKDCN